MRLAFSMQHLTQTPASDYSPCCPTLMLNPITGFLIVTVQTTHSLFSDRFNLIRVDHGGSGNALWM